MKTFALLSLIAFSNLSGVLCANTVTGSVPQGNYANMGVNPVIFWNFLANSGDLLDINLTVLSSYQNFPGSAFEVIDPSGRGFAGAFNNGSNHASFLNGIVVPTTGDFEIGILSTDFWGYQYQLDVEGSTAGGELVFGNNPELGPEPSATVLLALAVVGLGLAARRRAAQLGGRRT